MSELLTGAETQGAQATTVETNGVNPVPDAERHGKPRDLFAVWFAWNVSILGVSYGIYVFGLGLSVWQAILAGLLGYVISTFLVGVLAVGGPRTGLPTLTQTRFAFGFQGNKFPAFFAYLSNTGWQVVTITVASTTGANLFARLWPDTFAKSGGGPVNGMVGVWLAIVLAAVLVVVVFGHGLIMKVESWISWVTGIMTIWFIAMIVPHIHWSELGSAKSGSAMAFVGGIVMAMTMVGLGFLNCGGDFSRYLPRKTRARGIIGWTTAGISLPVTFLLILGVLLVASDPQLGAKAAADPIGALTSLLPTWFFVPFSIVIVISLVSGAMTGVYSSGLALLSLGLPVSRVLTTAINAVIIAAGAFYLLFVSTSFLATFQAYLALISVVMGTLGGIQLLDFIRQKRLGWNTDMAQPFGYGGRTGRWTALAAIIVATVIGLGMVTSSDPNIAKVVGFLLSDSQKTGVIGTSNVGVIVAMVIGSAIYAILTYALHIQVPPDYSKDPQRAAAGASTRTGGLTKAAAGGLATAGGPAIATDAVTADGPEVSR